MLKLNIIGNFFGTDGYSLHTRNLANFLANEGVDVRVDTGKFPGWETQVNDTELNMLSKDLDRDATTLMITTPPSWRFGLAEGTKKFIGFVVWEGDRMPKYWEKYIKQADLIFVPSKHVQDALPKGVKSHIIPHGVDTNLFKPRTVEDDVKNFKKTAHIVPKQLVAKDKPFTFVCCKGWRGGMEDRGGVQYLIKAFSEEFKPTEDVQLILKLNPAYLPPNFSIKTEMEKLQKEGNFSLGKKTKHKKKLMKISTDNLPYTLLPNFYNEGDVFVCPTRGEAFNIPGLEAMACGLPTIQTDFGGQTDYIQHSINGYLVKYKLEYVTSDILYEGVKWATPDMEDLKLLMRSAFQNREKMKEFGKEARKTAEKFTWKASAKKVINALRK